MGCIVFAVSRFDWVMIILHLLQKYRLLFWICLAWDWRSVLHFLSVDTSAKRKSFSQKDQVYSCCGQVYPRAYARGGGVV